MKQRLLIFVFILLAFCSGSVLGFIVNSQMVCRDMKAMRDNPELHWEKIFESLKTKLSLDQQQAKVIREIVKDHFSKTEEIRQKSMPELKAEMDRYQKAVDKQLNDSQKEEWANVCQWVREYCYGFSCECREKSSKQQ